MKIKLNNIDIELSEEQVKEIVEKYVEKEEIALNTSYWLINNCGNKISSVWSNYTFDNYNRNIGNFFLKESDCNKEVERMQALARVKGYIRKNKLGKEFVREYSNWLIYTFRGCLDIDGFSSTNYYPILGYLISKEACEQVIKDCEADLKIIFKI